MRQPRICFLVGSIAISGGTYVIFQHASYLIDQGYDVTLAIQSPFDANTAKWHDHSGKFNLLPVEIARTQRYDLVIATWWKTALELHNFQAPRHAYFVQSIESRFYPEAEEPLRKLVNSTYGLPVSYITEARWIVEHLDSNFGQKATLVRNGIRKDIYSESGTAISNRPIGQPRVLVEGHFNISFKNTALALQIARHAGAKDIWVMTGSPVRRLPGASRVFSRVPILRTPQVYRSCDVLLKLSTVEGMFGPPLEMFHCGGTSVVLNVSGHDEYIRHKHNALVVSGLNPANVIEALRSLLSDRKQLETLKKGARQTASDWPDWGSSSAEFTRWVALQLQEGRTTELDKMGALIQAAWNVYARAERDRLEANPSIGWANRLKGLAHRLSRINQERILGIRATAEAAFPPKQIL